MKKLLFILSILFGTMFISCNKNSTTNTEVVDSVKETIMDTTYVDILIVDGDTITVDTI